MKQLQKKKIDRFPSNGVMDYVKNNCEIVSNVKFVFIQNKKLPSTQVQKYFRNTFTHYNPSYCHVIFVVPFYVYLRIFFIKEMPK